MDVTTRLATIGDAAAIARIYNQGSRSGSRPSRRSRARRRRSSVSSPRRGTVIRRWWSNATATIVAWAGAGPYRSREAYAGVAEHSVYTARHARGTGAGRAALDALIREYESRGFWKLVSRIFPENRASLILHERAGFRVVGVYRRHGRLEGEWRDCVIVERLLRRRD